jgi:membrane protease YdiL (CAAX protease family)
MLLFPIGFSVIYTFAKRRPAPIFDGSVKKIPEQSVALLYETPLLYLFLLFPVASFLISVLPYAGSIFFHLLYIPVTFVAILYYFIRSSGSPASLRSLLGMDEKQNPLREVGFGIIGFTAIFPVALLSLLFSFGVAGNDLETVRFAHPITFEVGSHFWPVFFLAVVIAPITEEIIFRGFIFGYLRRHLPLRRAALLTGMIFAILHPQGWLAFLYLTVVGGGLAILREYRPGLIAPIVTHAMINSFAVISIHLLWSI